MHYKILPPASASGVFSLPSSKSISNRALLIGALSGSDKTPRNVSDCDDTKVMLQALQGHDDPINIGAAGTAMRFLSAYLAVIPGTHRITGTERMQHRPIGILVDALRSLGAQIDYLREEGFPPLQITGGIHGGGSLSLPGHVSSQYISALLMIGPMLDNGLTLTLTGDVISRPYINLTLQLMHDFGAKGTWQDDHTITVQNGGYQPTDYLIENDWSAASYAYQIVALSQDPQTEIRLPGLFSPSYQGDSAVADIFRPLGVETTLDEEGVVVLRQAPCTLTHYEYDFIGQPDLAQTVVVTCVLKGIPFRFTGLQSLKIKETDRLNALCVELGKLGYDIHEEDARILCWDGTRTPAQSHPAIDTYEDHRMAMAFAPICLQTGESIIHNPEVVSKSFPTYWSELQKMGFSIVSEP